MVCHRFQKSWRNNKSFCSSLAGVTDIAQPHIVNFKANWHLKCNNDLKPNWLIMNVRNKQILSGLQHTFFSAKSGQSNNSRTFTLGVPHPRNTWTKVAWFHRLLCLSVSGNQILKTMHQEKHYFPRGSVWKTNRNVEYFNWISYNKMYINVIWIYKRILYCSHKFD